MKTSWRLWILLGLACSAGAASAVDRPGKPVVVGNTSAMRSGTLLREKREVRVEAGRTRQEIGTNITEATTRYVLRVNWVRRVMGVDAEEVQVRELMKECVHFFRRASAAERDRRAVLQNIARPEKERALGL
jgi:hypothetical protein